MPMPKPMSCPSRRHFSVKAPIAVAHFKRHQHRLKGGVIDWNWVVEDHHHSVTSIAFKRAAILDDDLADGRMVVAQQRHHVFCVGAFGEAGETAQVTEERGNLSPMAFELLLGSRSDDQIGYLRRKETPQSAHALDFAHLIGDALFELLV